MCENGTEQYIVVQQERLAGLLRPHTSGRLLRRSRGFVVENHIVHSHPRLVAFAGGGSFLLGGLATHVGVASVARMVLGAPAARYLFA